MEAYASAALVGAGYAFNRNQDPHANIMSNKLNSSDVPSMKSLYDSKHWDEVRQQEFGLSTNMWNQAQTPMETGVVPKPAYADQFIPITPKFNKSGADAPKNQFNLLQERLFHQKTLNIIICNLFTVEM